MKLKEEERYEVINFCINYLYDKHPNERGLFRSAVSQTDVRLLQSQIAQHSVKQRDELDPHLIAEVLNSTLKDLNSPLFHEIYKDIVQTELVEDDFNVNQNMVQKWILKIPDTKYPTVLALFRLLGQLASLEENETGLIQLAHCVAPVICRPLTSAFMSILHMEDLKVIRPVILFLMENYSDLFILKRPAQTPRSSVQSLDGMNDAEREGALSDMMATAMVIDPLNSQRNSMDEVKFGEMKESKSDLLISTTNSANQSLLGEAIDLESDKLLTTSNEYTDSDWKSLLSLINLRVCSFLSFDDQLTNDLIAKDASGDTYHIAMESYSAKIALDNSLTNQGADGPGSSSSGKITPSTVLSQMRRNHRRKLVAECKGYRSQIYEYEQDFIKKNNRLPKSQERGNMGNVYTKYRDLKREIRDAASTDIARVARGFLSRVKFNKLRAQEDKKALPKTSNETKSSTPSQSKDISKKEVNFANSELITKFREILDQKRELKRKLKKFDEDFLEKYGRNPKKSDKEVIRPMYQKYHELKGQLELMKKDLQLTNNQLPDDLMDEILTMNRVDSVDSKRPSISQSDSELEVDDSDKKPGRSSFIDDEDSKANISIDSGDKPISNNPTLENLIQEKKNLHNYLKVYERDFNRTHGRPVMKNEDILPVANEYQRYKELKNLIKEMKG